MKVWDRPVRALHWALVLGVTAAWVTAERWTFLHERTGYAVLAIATGRVLWGLIGGRHARFRRFVRSPVDTADYARRLLKGREPRFLGHNPLGAWMVVALLLCVIGTAATGWLFTTDAFWGSDAVQTLHRVLAWSLLGLIALHLAGVVVTSIRHRENLMRAMFDGIKRAPAGDDVA